MMEVEGICRNWCEEIVISGLSAHGGELFFGNELRKICPYN